MYANLGFEITGNESADIAVKFIQSETAIASVTLDRRNATITHGDEIASVPRR